jgi:uncharacterized protein YbcI
MNSEKSKGMVEAEISEALIKFEKEYMGRGPLETRTWIVDDMVIVRMKGVLSRAESQLAKTGDGVELIKKVRTRMLEELHDEMYAVIKDITGCRASGMHTDVSTGTGERVIIFTLECSLEEKILKNRKK